MAKRRTASDWADLVAGWKRSGGGAVDFAASAGVSAVRLRWWKWHLARSAQPSPKSAMVRVEVREQRPIVTTAAPIEITRGGWTVRVGHGVDGETLGQVLDVLAARPC
jgi:hypothetical protein